MLSSGVEKQALVMHLSRNRVVRCVHVQPGTDSRACGTAGFVISTISVTYRMFSRRTL